ncbi:hypothetical protein [Vibrio owensii]|uniref:hypothetical protein n=1 Tax=Vibrio owensii TaxID=696485 RepID=UPI003CC64D84
MGLSKNRALEFLDFIKNSNYYLLDGDDSDLESFAQAKEYIEKNLRELYLLSPTKGHLNLAVFLVSWDKGEWCLTEENYFGDKRVSVKSPELNELIDKLHSEYNATRTSTDFELVPFDSYYTQVHKITDLLSVQTVGFNELASQGLLSDEAKNQITSASDSDKMQAMKVLAINLHESRMSVQGAYRESIDKTIKELLLL